MDVVEIGKTGLTGVRGRVVRYVSGPVSRRTPWSRDQIEALVGAVFLALACWRFWKMVRRA